MPRAFTPLRFDPAAPDPATRAAWDRLLARAPTPFADLGVAAAVGQAFGLAPVGVALRSGPDAFEFAAGVIVYVKRRGPYRLAVVPPLVPYTPVLLAAPLRDAEVHADRSPLGALLDALLPLAHAHALHTDPSLRDVRAAQWRGWSARPLYTYRAALAPRDALLAGWSSTARRTVRHAADRFTLEEHDAPGPLVALCTASYERHGRGLPGGPEHVARLIERLRAAGRVRLFVAAGADGGPEAGVAVLHAGATAYYWLAGSRPGDAMTVLLGALLPRLHDEGYTTFDFVGANTASIAEFKRKFGPELVPFYRLGRILRPELRLFGDRLL